MIIFNYTVIMAQIILFAGTTLQLILTIREHIKEEKEINKNNEKTAKNVYH